MATFNTTLRPTPFELNDLSKEKRNKFGVYIIYFKNKGYFYIGSSNKCSHRINQHKYEIKNNTHANKRLLSVYKKYNKEVEYYFKYTNTREEALLIEQNLLKKYYNNNLCMNLSSDAYVPKHSANGRRRLSEKAIKQHKEGKFNLYKVAAYHKKPESRKTQSIRAKKQRENPEYTKNLTKILQEKLQKYWNVTLINPNGENVIIGWNLRKFCRDNNLDRGNLNKVIKGKQTTHKGWSLRHGNI